MIAAIIILSIVAFVAVCAAILFFILFRGMCKSDADKERLINKCYEEKGTTERLSQAIGELAQAAYNLDSSRP